MAKVKLKTKIKEQDSLNDVDESEVKNQVFVLNLMPTKHEKRCSVLAAGLNYVAKRTKDQL